MSRRSPDHLLGEKPKPDLPFSLFPDPELNKQSLVYRIKVGLPSLHTSTINNA